MVCGGINVLVRGMSEIYICYLLFTYIEEGTTDLESVSALPCGILERVVLWELLEKILENVC